MKALVSTYSSILLVDLETGLFNVVEEDRKWYYGITWDTQGKVYYNHSYLTDLDLTNGNSEDQQKGKVSANLRNPKSSESCLACPHQMIYHEGYVYVTNTGLNAIEKFSSDLTTRRTVRIGEELWDQVYKKKVGYHYNSVFIQDGLLYVVAHNWDNPSFVKALDLHTFKVVRRIDIPGTFWAHNVFVDNNSSIYVCNTKAGSLVEITSNDVVWQCQNPGHELTRGLAVTDNYIVVGKTPFNPDRASRGKKRDTNDHCAGLWVLDRSTFKLIKYINLPGHSSLGEVRVLNEVDYAHNGIILKESQL
jgi:hypothetical protein